jgi:hypothetical protein
MLVLIPGGDHKLYVGMLCRKTNEGDLRKLFEPYGNVVDVHLMLNGDGSSKGAFCELSLSAALAAFCLEHA